MWSGLPPMLKFHPFFWAFLLFTCGYALWRGRKYEQLSALIFIAASLVSVAAREPLHQRYLGIEVGDLVVDLVVLGALTAIALRSDRFWPLWVAGLQLTISMSHLLKAVQPDLVPLAYAAAERFWSYPTLLILFVGAWRQHRRRRTYAEFRTGPATLA
jgi:hypothetical protein